MKCYLFDVDGTLTEPRKRIEEKFAKKFARFADGIDVYIATGSDFTKTKEQLPQETLDLFKGIFCCMGNEMRGPNGGVLQKSDFVIPDDLNDDLGKILIESEYKHKVGRHIEFRTGMVNFSTVGRRANHDQRKHYSDWDAKNKERQKIANYINREYPNLEASVGGSISIDIIEKGKDKGQVVHWLVDQGYDQIIFFGDRCYPGGNDWGIVREMEKSDLSLSLYYNVKGPQDVEDILQL